MTTYTITESLRKRLIENREHAQVRELLRNLTPNSGEVAAPSNLVNGLTEAETDESMSVRGLSQKAAPSTSAEPIYQYQLANGGWIDQTKEMYDHLIKRGGATVRAVYLSAPSTSPADIAEIERLIELVKNQNAYLMVADNQLQTALAEISALKAAPSTSHDSQDSARYRWLRDPCSDVTKCYYSRGDYGRGLMNTTMLDEAVDAAIKGGA